MTQFISDREQISLTRRQHNDPPALWITVATFSVILHLLVFWLMRSSALGFLSFKHSNQARSTPIELVEVPLKGKKNPGRRKTVRQSTTQKPAPTAPLVKPKVVEKPATTNQKLIAAKPQPTQVPAPQPPKVPQSTSTQITATPPKSQKITPTLTPTPDPIPTPTPTNSTPIPDPIPTSTPTNSTPIPDPIPTPTPTNSTPTPTPTPTPIPTPNSTPTPTPKRSETISSRPTTQDGKKPRESLNKPLDRSTNNSSPDKTNLNQVETGGGLIKISHIFTYSEHKKMWDRKELAGDAPPDNLAKYLGSGSKPIAPSWLGVSSKLQPATILVNLVIDQEGKFFTASIIEINPPSLQGQKAQYEELLGKIYQNEKFKPGYNNNAKDPIVASNLLVNVIISPIVSK